MILKYKEYIKENIEEEGKLLFKASTQGNKYIIEAFEKKNIHGVYYDIDELTNGVIKGMTSSNKLRNLKYNLANIIVNSKDIDGINYIIDIDKINVIDEIHKMKNVNDTINSKEFKEWFSSLDVEDKHKIDNDAREYAKQIDFSIYSYLRKEYYISVYKKSFTLA